VFVCVDGPEAVTVRAFTSKTVNTSMGCCVSLPGTDNVITGDNSRVVVRFCAVLPIFPVVVVPVAHLCLPYSPCGKMSQALMLVPHAARFTTANTLAPFVFADGVREATFVTLASHCVQVECIAPSRSGSHVYTGGSDGSVHSLSPVPACLNTCFVFPQPCGVL
jgi:hypothetical protein